MIYSIKMTLNSLLITVFSKKNIHLFIVRELNAAKGIMLIYSNSKGDNALSTG